MESEASHALALRMRQMSLPIGAGFAVACAGSAVCQWMLAGPHPRPWLGPASGVPVVYLAAALVFIIAGPFFYNYKNITT